MGYPKRGRHERRGEVMEGPSGRPPPLRKWKKKHTQEGLRTFSEKNQA